MRAAVLVLAAVACSAEPRDPLRLDVPVRAEHRAALIAVERPGSVEVHARAIVEGSIAPLVEPISADTRVTVLLYVETLAELAIVAGEVASVDEGRALPAADLTLETKIDTGIEASWSEVQMRSPAVDAIRIGGTASPCKSYTPITMELGASRTRFALAIPGRGVLVENEEGVLRLFGPDRSVTMLATDPKAYHAMLDSSGALWLAGARGEIWRGMFAGQTIAMTRTSTLGTDQDVLFIDGDPLTDLYAQTRDGAVHHFDGSTWRVIARIHGRGRPTGIARITSGEAVSAWGDCLCVIRHRGDNFEELAIPANSISSNGVSALLHDASYGTVAGTFIGELLEAEDDVESWTKIQGTYATIQITSLAMLGDHVVYADHGGVAVERIRGFGYCDPLPPERPADMPGHVAVIDDQIVVASDVLTWWTPRP